MRESQIQSSIRSALNRDGRCRVVRFSVGYDEAKRIRYGQVGAPDLIGVLRDGHAFCVEVKRQGDRLRPEQQAWWRWAREWGVRGGVATSVEEALALLDAATT